MKKPKVGKRYVNETYHEFKERRRISNNRRRNRDKNTGRCPK